MTKDFAKKFHKDSKPRKTHYYGIIALIFFTGFVIYYKGYRANIIMDEVVVSEETQKINNTKESKQVTKPRFEFYTMLPEVESPKEFQSNDNEDNAEEVGNFILQIAAFRRIDDAHRLIKELKDKGFNATQHKAKNSYWHSVQVGPFATKSLATGVAKKLSFYNYKIIIINKKS